MKNKIDSENEHYITINSNCDDKQYNFDLSKANLDRLNSIGKSLNEALKPIVEESLNITKLLYEQLPDISKKFEVMIEPIVKKTKEIITYYDPIVKASMGKITELFKSIDWSKFDLIFKEIAIIHLLNGFYPYRHNQIEYNSLLDTASREKQTKIIREGLELDVKIKKKELILIYPEHKKYINEIYKLYGQKNYRLCILSLINLISIINNSQFTYMDFTEKDRIRGKLLENQIMNEKETNYILFSPYIEDQTLKSANLLTKNYSDTPEKYLKIPYNRNAIMHGYSANFGKKINCLRWFSVLFNSMEITQKIKNIENEFRN